jgi:lysophospholipase L1-like esterase
MSDLFTYVAFGDSITDSYGVSRGFVSHVSARLAGALPERETVTHNRGMSGDNSTDAIYRLQRDVLDADPDLVTINFGVNDAFSWISPDKFESNLAAMVESVKENGCHRIVLVSSEVIPEPQAEKQVLPYWRKMRQVAEAAGIVYADANGHWQGLLDSGVDQWTLIIPGDMHPNEAGHEVIAEAVWEAIEESGLLEGA